MKFTLPRLFLFCLLILLATLFGIGLYAQTTPRITWDQPGAGLVEVQSLTYKTYVDAATTGTLLNGVSCVGTASPFQCQAPFTGYPSGNHTLTLTASDSIGESAKSNSVPFGPPGAPSNLRIVK